MPGARALTVRRLVGAGAALTFFFAPAGRNYPKYAAED
jgi:hypothetical protein